MGSSNRRSQPRLHLDHGQARLMAQGLNPLAGRIVDMSTTGCLLSVAISELDPVVTQRWMDLLHEEKMLNVELNLPPDLDRVTVRAKSIHFEISKSKVDWHLGLHFHKLNRKVYLAVKKMLESTAMAILRKEHLRLHPKFSPPEPPSLHPELRGLEINEILLELKLLTEGELEHACREADWSRQRLDRYLLHAGMLHPRELARAYAAQSGLPMHDLDMKLVSQDWLHRLPYLKLMQYEFVPLEEHHDQIRVALARPLSDESLNKLEKLFGRRVMPVLAPADQVFAVLHDRSPNQRVNRRKKVRYKAELDANYLFCDRQGIPFYTEEYAGLILDMSEEGFGLIGLKPRENLIRLILQGEIWIKIAFQVETRVVRVLGRIMHASNAAPGCRPQLPWYFGIQAHLTTRDDIDQLRLACIRLGLWRGLKSAKFTQ